MKKPEAEIKKRMDNLRKQVKIKLAEKKRDKDRLVTPTPPRYDDVYWKGLEWLNNL
jgi:hypothetical protein